MAKITVEYLRELIWLYNGEENRDLNKFADSINEKASEPDWISEAIEKVKIKLGYGALSIEIFDDSSGCFRDMNHNALFHFVSISELKKELQIS